MATTQATIARDIAGTDGLWHHTGTKLAEDVPHYMNKDNGRPNFHQITTAAKNLGYDEINADNLAQVIQELRDRVDAPEDPAPNVQEPEPEPPVDPAALVAACERLPEPPVVAFTDVISPNGFRWAFTMKAGLSPDLARDSVGQMINLIKVFEQSALAAGWSAPGNGNGRKPAAPAQSAPPVTGGNAPPVAGQGNGDLTFQAETLSGNVSEGNVYWKVKGGKYKQWGVTIWPEVLTEAGFDSDGLDPMQTYNITGYVAHYITNDSGNPQKVTSLARQ